MFKEKKPFLFCWLRENMEFTYSYLKIFWLLKCIYCSNIISCWSYISYIYSFIYYIIFNSWNPTMMNFVNHNRSNKIELKKERFTTNKPRIYINVALNLPIFLTLSLTYLTFLVYFIHLSHLLALNSQKGITR